MAPSRVVPVHDLAGRRRIVEESFRREAGSTVPLPEDAVDLIETGALDSMGWVSFLRTVESACGVSDLGARLTQRPASMARVLEALQEAHAEEAMPQSFPSFRSPSESRVHAFLSGSSSVVGSRLLPSEEVDRLFGMPIGKLRSRAGIESIAYAANGESELTLGTAALREALRSGSCGPQDLDWIIATSETHHDYPSLASQLHSQLLVRETCGALDVGGACLGLLNALAVAQALIASGQARTVAVVTADVHSRTLTPGRVAGEFGGLFGDGASAFLLRSGTNESLPGYRLGEFLFGCAGQYAAAIRVSDDKDGGLAVQFDGEALSRAAITRMEKVLAAVELRSRIPRASVGGFATHQPNPRLVKLLAKQLGVSPAAFPAIARTSGNLGSSTCGAALHAAIRAAATLDAPEQKPIFLASLGPGLLYGGGWLAAEPKHTVKDRS
jgi:3-oxoacyl-[acyl-carrier-protein] synthase-3